MIWIEAAQLAVLYLWAGMWLLNKGKEQGRPLRGWDGYVMMWTWPLMMIVQPLVFRRKK